MVFQTANGDLRIPHNHNRWIQMCKPPDWQTEPSSTMVLCILMLTGVLRMAAWVHKGAADWDCIKEMNVTAFPIESFQRQQQSRIRGRAFGKQIHSTCCWDICISSCALGNRSYRSSEAVWAALFNDTLWYYRRTCLSIYQRCTTENVCFFFTLFELTGFNFHTHLVHNMIGMALSVIVVCPVKWGHRQSPVYPPYLWSSPSVSVRLSGSVSLHLHHSTVWASGGFWMFGFWMIEAIQSVAPNTPKSVQLSMTH